MSWAAIVLAAGRSSRMGPAHKLLEDLHGKSLIRHVIDAAREAGLQPIVLVSGYRGDEVARAAGTLGITQIDNPDYAAGMMTSIQCGLAAVPVTAQGAVILLGDMPLLTANPIRKTIEALEAQPAALAAVPVYGDEWGHPVVMRHGLFKEVMNLSGDRGARALLKSRLDQVVEVPIDDPAILVDLDTPEALEKARRQSPHRDLDLPFRHRSEQ